jgi:3-hydroxyisobutyrate dehydrogenase-like beta-hydroxyacid dehydrogenase
VKIGFIGLGVQGKYLAINLADAGHDLMVFDLRREPLDELSAHGAKVATSCRDVGAHAEVTCVCVLDDEQLRAHAGAASSSCTAPWNRRPSPSSRRPAGRAGSNSSTLR